VAKGDINNSQDNLKELIKKGDTSFLRKPLDGTGRVLN
jgi:hypothetical protein